MTGGTDQIDGVDRRIDPSIYDRPGQPADQSNRGKAFDLSVTTRRIIIAISIITPIAFALLTFQLYLVTHSLSSLNATREKVEQLKAQIVEMEAKSSTRTQSLHALVDSLSTTSQQKADVLANTVKQIDTQVMQVGDIKNRTESIDLAVQSSREESLKNTKLATSFLRDQIEKLKSIVVENKPFRTQRFLTAVEPLSKGNLVDREKSESLTTFVFRVELEIEALSKNPVRDIQSAMVSGLEKEEFSLSAEFESSNSVIVRLATEDGERVERLLDYDIKIWFTFHE